MTEQAVRSAIYRWINNLTMHKDGRIPNSQDLVEKVLNEALDTWTRRLCLQLSVDSIDDYLDQYEQQAEPETDETEETETILSPHLLDRLTVQRQDMRAILSKLDRDALTDDIRRLEALDAELTDIITGRWSLDLEQVQLREEHQRLEDAIDQFTRGDVVDSEMILHETRLRCLELAEELASYKQ